MMGLLLGYLALGPPLLMFIVSQWVPVYIERALLPSGVMFFIWAAWALAADPVPRIVRGGVTAVLLAGFLIGLQTHLTYDGFPYAPFAEINESLQARGAQEDGAVIVHSNKLTALPAYLEAPDLPHRYLRDLPGSGSDTLARPTQAVIGFYADEDMSAAVGEAERVWLVVFERELQEFRATGVDLHPALAWLDEAFRQVRVEKYGDVAVYEYTALP